MFQFGVCPHLVQQFVRLFLSSVSSFLLVFKSKEKRRKEKERKDLNELKEIEINLCEMFCDDIGLCVDDRFDHRILFDDRW